MCIERWNKLTRDEHPFARSQILPQSVRLVSRIIKRVDVSLDWKLLISRQGCYGFGNRLLVVAGTTSAQLCCSSFVRNYLGGGERIGRAVQLEARVAVRLFSRGVLRCGYRDPVEMLEQVSPSNLPVDPKASLLTLTRRLARCLGE